MTAEPTLIVTTPTPTDLSVERVFNAPARLVWDAHTRPELVRQWLLGPDGWSMPVCEIDCRVGGAYRYEWSHPEQPSFGTGGEFTEVTPTSRLVTTERMDGFDGETLNTMTLLEADGRTTLTLLMRFESQEARDAAAATGMADGIGVSFDRLEAAMRDWPPTS